MSRQTLLYTFLGLLVLLVGAAFAVTYDMKPDVVLVEKVLPDDRFPR